MKNNACSVRTFRRKSTSKGGGGDYEPNMRYYNFKEARTGVGNAPGRKHMKWDGMKEKLLETLSENIAHRTNGRALV